MWWGLVRQRHVLCELCGTLKKQGKNQGCREARRVEMARVSNGGANNPRRAFAETVSLVAWQSEFGDGGVADLFIDCVFMEGRVGGGSGSPIRFRLSLKQAEVHVLRDLAGVLNLPASLVDRSEPIIGTKSTAVESTKDAKGNGSLKLDATTIAVQADIGAGASYTVTEKSLIEQPIATMEITARATSEGWAFVIVPRVGKKLIGPAFASAKRRLAVQDNAYPRKRGEAPDVRVELRCRREDLIIEDVQFMASEKRSFLKLPKLKRTAVEQYIKEELTRVGFDVGDLNDKFAELILADVTPERSAPLGPGD